MSLTLPETTKSYGNQRLVVLSSVPSDIDGATITEILAGDNITCHMVGDWWPTASTEKVTRQRKMCQTRTTTTLGTTTHEVPALRYTANPQTANAPGGDGNEAFDALAEGASVFLVQILGLPGNTLPVATNKYRLFPVDLGPQVWAASADDAGGEFVITQEVSISEGYDEPVDGVVAAAP